VTISSLSAVQAGIRRAGVVILIGAVAGVNGSATSPRPVVTAKDVAPSSP
jgi:hypothetical protein